MKIKNVTYIPIKVVPKVYSAAFRKPVKKQEDKPAPNKPTHVITLDDNHYVPVTNKTVKPVRFDGVTYIPVYQVTSDVAKTLKKVPVNGTVKVDIFKIADIHYIPKNAIHEDFRQIFRPKVTPVVHPKPVI